MNDNLDIELEQKKEVLEEGETLMALEQESTQANELPRLKSEKFKSCSNRPARPPMMQRNFFQNMFVNHVNKIKQSIDNGMCLNNKRREIQINA